MATGKQSCILGSSARLTLTFVHNDIHYCQRQVLLLCVIHTFLVSREDLGAERRGDDGLFQRAYSLETFTMSLTISVRDVTN